MSTNNDDGLNFVNNHEASPYIVEKSHSNGIRVIHIIGWKSLYYGMIVLLVMQLLLVIMAFTLFNDIPFFKVLFIVLNLPIIIPLLFVPVKAVCTFDYNNKKFSSCQYPIIPIPYTCFSINVNFSDISFFYFYKINQMSKKFYKIGINKMDGVDQDILLGQDHSCSTEFDPKITRIPSILKSFLRE